MKRMIKRLFSFVFLRIVKRERTKRIIIKLLETLNIDILEMAHFSKGILKYQNSFVSGEDFLLKNVLVPYFRKNRIDSPVLFDIGANKGFYSKELSKIFPSSTIFSFEPNPLTFASLKQNTAELANVKCYNIGFGSQETTSVIYTYNTELESEHASLFKDVLVEMHKAPEVSEINVSIDTLDSFCEKQQIGKIDFLKVDTEGFELEVIKGGTYLFQNTKVDILQFEFNEMNIVSKVFLKDFYEQLKGYKFYRLDSKRLIPLYEYDSINEIFKFHNILAVKEEISNKLVNVI